MGKEKITCGPEVAQNQLDHFVKMVFQNEILFHILKTRLQTVSEKEALETLGASRTLTKEDWLLFNKLLDKVHINFIKNMHNIQPNLSPSEMRYLSLVKLGFSFNDISSLEGVSFNSIHVRWHRLRKKLNLSPEVTPESFIKKLESGN